MPKVHRPKPIVPVAPPTARSKPDANEVAATGGGSKKRPAASAAAPHPKKAKQQQQQDRHKQQLPAAGKDASKKLLKGNIQKRALSNQGIVLTAAAGQGNTAAVDASRDSEGAAADRSTSLLFCKNIVDRQAANALSRLLEAAERKEKGATLKSLTLAQNVLAKKATYAVTCEVLKYMPVLRVLAEQTSLTGPSARMSPATAYVLIFELLQGEGLHQRGPAEHWVAGKKKQLKAALTDMLEEAGVETVGELLAAGQPEIAATNAAAQHPRWARVNLLKATVQQALQLLRETVVKGQGAAGAAKLADSVQVDDLLPDVLNFPPGTDLHAHPLVKQGILILQSKASCLPAHALSPEPSWNVVDCCAAPGNKTTHIASLMAGGSGKVFAFDRDGKRLKRLKENASRAGASAIVAKHADFLALDTQAEEYAQVQGVLLDPSCSGSGTPTHLTDQQLSLTLGGNSEEAASTAEDGDAPRVAQLRKFQVMALRHALTFPALQRLVYSTCSIYRQENEDVVAEVLEDATAKGFHLVDPFPSWHRRGLPVFEGCDNLVRTDQHEDGTDGFFVAVFDKRKQSPTPPSARRTPSKQHTSTPGSTHSKCSLRPQQEDTRDEQGNDSDADDAGKAKSQKAKGQSKRLAPAEAGRISKVSKAFPAGMSAAQKTRALTAQKLKQQKSSSPGLNAKSRSISKASPKGAKPGGGPASHSKKSNPAGSGEAGGGKSFAKPGGKRGSGIGQASPKAGSATKGLGGSAKKAGGGRSRIPKPGGKGGA